MKPILFIIPLLLVSCLGKDKVDIQTTASYLVDHALESRNGSGVAIDQSIRHLAFWFTRR
ncbi:MAG: hypothetical protein R2852_07410 [Bacteroidia bacterium]